jgi:hypothetical protein
MDERPRRSTARLAVGLTGLAMAFVAGCSERPTSKPPLEARTSGFRKIRFAGDWVVVRFRSAGPRATVPEVSPGFLPRPGDRIVLSGEGDGEIFLGGDLAALQFYHSSPKPDQLETFRSLADSGKLFLVARGTTAVVSEVVEGALPEGFRAIQLTLPGEKGGIAWASEPFVRRLVEAKK